jgi:hypothetical protein
LEGICGSANYVEYDGRFGEHGDVAAVDFGGHGTHTFRHEALQFGLDGAIVLSHDVLTRLRPPSSALNLLLEQVGSRREVGRPDNLLLRLREIPGKGLHPIREHPDPAIRNFDV